MFGIDVTFIFNTIHFIVALIQLVNTSLPSIDIVTIKSSSIGSDTFKVICTVLMFTFIVVCHSRNP